MHSLWNWTLTGENIFCINFIDLIFAEEQCQVSFLVTSGIEWID